MRISHKNIEELISFDYKNEDIGFGQNGRIKHSKELQAISKKSFGPISLLESKLKSSEYLSMRLEDPDEIGRVLISPPPRS